MLDRDVGGARGARARCGGGATGTAERCDGARVECRSSRDESRDADGAVVRGAASRVCLSACARFFIFHSSYARLAREAERLGWNFELATTY